jgi:alkylated DNA repair dioxygenase AlkB
VTRPDTAEPQRIRLDATSWVDVVREWLTAECAAELFYALRTGVDWKPGRLWRYDHWVTERRLGASWRPGRPLPHPLLPTLQRELEARYDVAFRGFGMLLYRSGADGQGFHRDTELRWLDDTLVAVLSLGARRPWLLRPRSARYDPGPRRGATCDLAPGPGDLIVMGGRCQADWEHAVPYQPGRAVGVRISVQWRHAARRGEPYRGPSWRAPRTWSA